MKGKTNFQAGRKAKDPRKAKGPLGSGPWITVSLVCPAWVDCRFVAAAGCPYDSR
jgi:hypothetical protein